MKGGTRFRPMAKARGIRAGFSMKAMVPRRLSGDPELTLKMLVTMTLLGAVYVGFIWVLLRLGLSFLPMVVIAGGMLLVQYYFSDRLVLRSTGARLVAPAEAPELHEMIGRLAGQAGLPMPRVAIVPTDLPNAFATGRNARHAVVAVTNGLRQRLNPEELEAVLGHELTHVRNRDMTVITMASFFATVASYITQMSLWFGFGLEDRESRDGGAWIYLVSAAVWATSFLLIQALSRYREFAADRGSAILTGHPSHLASALQKISGEMRRRPDRELKQAEPLSAFFIIPALSRDSLLGLLSTHPSLENRLQRLERLAAELEP